MEYPDCINAIIIDDESRGVTNLHHYLALYCPCIRVIGTATSEAAAISLLRSGTFRLAFLDIEFGDHTIFPLLEALDTIGFSIVFVTAYDRYAVKAFKVEALDYILKPLLKQDIIACYQKILKKFSAKDDHSTRLPAPHPAEQQERKVILRKRDTTYVVQQQDIHYLKAMGAYTEVVFSFRGSIQSVLVSKTLGILEEEYDHRYFFRVHKSYLINLNRVTGIHKKATPVVEIGHKETIPIAKRRIHDLLSSLHEHQRVY